MRSNKVSVVIDLTQIYPNKDYTYIKEQIRKLKFYQIIKYQDVQELKLIALKSLNQLTESQDPIIKRGWQDRVEPPTIQPNLARWTNNRVR